MFSLAGFLELINNMLTTGMVPALFADEERASIIEGVSRATFCLFSEEIPVLFLYDASRCEMKH